MLIYAIGSDSQQKIGVSKDPSKRLSTLQTGNPEKLSVHYTFPVKEDIAFLFEKYIHRDQNHKRVKGEWFALSANEVKDLMAFFEIHSESISARL